MLQALDLYAKGITYNDKAEATVGWWWGTRRGGDYDELFGNFQLPSNFLVFISLERHLGSVACEIEPGRVR